MANIFTLHLQLFPCFLEWKAVESHQIDPSLNHIESQETNAKIYINFICATNVHIYMNKKPPRLATWIIQRLLPINIRQSALGDFWEEFYYRIQNKGLFWARIYYWLLILKLLPAFVKNQGAWLFMMFNNYFRISVRNILKHKGFSLINLTGLAIGIACTILIMLWVVDELSFDRFYSHSDQIYRINLKDNRKNPVTLSSWTPHPVARYLKDNYPEVIAAAKIMYDHFQVTYKDKIFNEPQTIFTDPSFFKIFTLPVVSGNPEEMSRSPKNVVISEKMAKKYFGSEDPYGKIITLDTRQDVRVAAVVKIPANSDFQFDLFLPYSLINFYDSTMLKRWRNDWKARNSQTFVLVHPNCEVHKFEKKIAGITMLHVPERDIELFLQPLDQIHLYNPDGSQGTMVYVLVFIVIAVGILLIASINFIGLATARSEKRAKEVGLRKVVGASRFQLFIQFLYESGILIFLAFVMALVLVECSLPFFNRLVEKKMTLNLLSSTSLGIFVLILACTWILSAAYPAMFLSSFNTTRVLKGMIGHTGGKPLLRKSIVVFQFCISVFLLICTFLIYSQLRFILNKDLGMDTEHLVYLLMEGESKHRYQRVKAELNKHPGIISSAACYPIPVNIRFWAGFLDWQPNKEQRKVYFAYSFMDWDSIETLGMKIKEGRAFSKTLDSKFNRFIVNEEAVRQMGVGSPVGMELNFWGRKGKVIGVVKDFHFQHMSNRISPLVLVAGQEWTKRYLLVRIRPNDMKSALAHFRTVWQRINPGFAFEYRFLKDQFKRIYHFESRLGKILKLFTLLAVLISCLGLFGLASYIAEKRAKEVGIRKVLGSSVSGIVILLTKEFLKLVSIAIIIAWPISFGIMNTWLKGFAYQIGINFWIFIASGLIALIIASLTVGYQALKAATTNPITVIRCE
jgi:ABC-type antimicrobial peptide transport system permease subunit